MLAQSICLESQQKFPIFLVAWPFLSLSIVRASPALCFAQTRTIHPQIFLKKAMYNMPAAQAEKPMTVKGDEGQPNSVDPFFSMLYNADCSL